MDSSLAALNLFLKELGVLPDISSLESRKTIQKAVYLGQIAGADLGYRHGWYVHGPYSTGLANDYYRLNSPSGKEAQKVSGKTLKSTYRDALRGVKNLFEAPDGVDLEQPQWLELVASYDFLTRVSGYSDAKATGFIGEKKKNLYPYIESARTCLEKAGLR